MKSFVNLHSVQGIWEGGRKVLSLELGQNGDPPKGPSIRQTPHNCVVDVAPVHTLNKHLRSESTTTPTNRTIGSCSCPFFAHVSENQTLPKSHKVRRKERKGARETRTPTCSKQKRARSAHVSHQIALCTRSVHGDKQSRILTNFKLDTSSPCNPPAREYVDRTHTHNTHLCNTVCSHARNAHHALGSSHHGLHFIFVRLKRICHLVLFMSHPLLFFHLPFTTSTSSSSFTLPSTTTQEHTAQSVQQDQLQEHPVHLAHLQALPVDKLRHQESLWRENLQCGGNPRTTTPTSYEPKELATFSRIEDYSGDSYQLSDVQENFGEEVHRAPITEEVKEFGEIGTAGLPDSTISETSYFQSHMHFDDSAESIADSDLENGELQKMLTSQNVYAQKASGKPDAMVVHERGK